MKYVLLWYMFELFSLTENQSEIGQALSNVGHRIPTLVVGNSVK